MLKEEFVCDNFGRRLGILRTENNGDITALTWPGRLPVGLYVISQDQTIALPSRLPVSRGNTVVSFIFKK